MALIAGVDCTGSIVRERDGEIVILKCNSDAAVGNMTGNSRKR
jgi:hypothetical protein